MSKAPITQILICAETPKRKGIVANLLNLVLAHGKVVDVMFSVDRTYMDAEKRLANYWRDKTGLEWSDFDGFDESKKTPPNIRRRRSVMNMSTRDVRWKDVYDRIAEILCEGFPLSREEYHFALTTKLILSDLPYEIFYKVAWHEDKDYRWYGRKDKV